MQKIIPHLWYDKDVVEAANLYVSTFPNSKITHTTQLHDTPSGSVDVVTFELLGLEFQAISAGPLFKFNPSISFTVTCSTKEDVDRIWHKLIPGGQALMELGEYPFSERYGWLQDKYGLSWQLTYSTEAEAKITPVIMFVGEVCGRAEEAINFWGEIFKQAEISTIMRYPAGDDFNPEGSIILATFSLFGQEFSAMDSGYAHQFAFNEAISFIVNCDTQAEIDEYWETLSAVPEAEQCGWLKDKFGLSWQIVPASMDAMMRSGDKEKIARVTQAFLSMKKFDIAKLHRAYDGN